MLPEPFYTICIAAITAFVLWFSGRAWTWLHAPNVKISVGVDDRYVTRIPQTKWVELDRGRTLIPTGLDEEYHRVKIVNEWRIFSLWNPVRLFSRPDPAKGVICYLANIERWDESKAVFVPTEYVDFLPLEWSYIEESKPMDILVGPQYWLNFCFTEENNQNEFFLPTIPQPNVYAKGISGGGHYRLSIQIAGDNLDFNEPFFLEFEWRNGQLTIANDAKSQQSKYRIPLVTDAETKSRLPPPRVPNNSPSVKSDS